MLCIDGTIKSLSTDTCLVELLPKSASSNRYSNLTIIIGLLFLFVNCFVVVAVAVVVVIVAVVIVAVVVPIM